MRWPWRNLVRDVITSVRMSTIAVDYIQEHRLWQGLNQYKWLSKAFVAIAILIGLSFYQFFEKWYDTTDISQQGIFGAETGLFASMTTAANDIFAAGTYKYLIMLLVEVFVFHFVRRTLIIVTEERIKTDFKTFLATMYRMVGVTFFCALLEGACTTVFNIPLKMYGWQMLSPLVAVIVQAYFMGVVIVDNYNEVYHMTLRQSLAYCWQYAGVTLFVGGVVSALFLLPLLGVVMGPILGAVIAAHSMHLLYLKDLDREWVYKRYPKKLKKVKSESNAS